MLEELILENIKEKSFDEQYSTLNKFIIDYNYLSKPKLTKELNLEKELFKKANESLDKYYTKQTVAEYCYNRLVGVLEEHNHNPSLYLFVEPSAGSGVFLNSIKFNKVGFDLVPTKETSHKIIKNDFLVDDIRNKLNKEQLEIKKIIVGNPPFGNKSSLAIQFVNRSFEYSNCVAFIVPVQFRKWSVQSKINKSAKLIADFELQENAFEFLGKDYSVRCCFQIWVLDSFSKNIKDLRISQKPSVSHKDFECYQYNRTEQALKFFDYEWDFAVPRQGYQDYSKIVFDKNSCDKKQQWIFFKAKNKKALERLKKLDFVKLSKKNIGIPGFGKADVVQEYTSIYGV